MYMCMCIKCTCTCKYVHVVYVHVVYYSYMIVHVRVHSTCTYICTYMYCEHTCLAINYYYFFFIQGCIGIVKVGTFMYKGLPCPNPDDAKQSAAAIAISNLPVS